MINLSLAVLSLQSWDAFFRNANAGAPPGAAYQSPLLLSGSSQGLTFAKTQAVAQPNLEKLVADHLAVQSLIRAYQVNQKQTENFCLIFLCFPKITQVVLMLIDGIWQLLLACRFCVLFGYGISVQHAEFLGYMCAFLCCFPKYNLMEYYSILLKCKPPSLSSKWANQVCPTVHFMLCPGC